MPPPAAEAVADGHDDLYVSPACFVQTAESRFGPDVLDDLKAFVQESPHDSEMVFDDEDEDAEEDEDEDDGLDPDAGFTDMYDLDATMGIAGIETDPNHAQLGFPRIATTRNNLTALSQQYNLYFAAYQDRIYAYQPRRAGPHILPPPSLILHPRQSKLGADCGGALDQRFPHQINHIIVGNLGDLEILLFAYDDGDVAAYYTHSVARCIRVQSDPVRASTGSPIRQAVHPKPFFHENVGKSAWGLAIHQRSRLIAVGSNLHEATVFAFALTRTSVAVKFPEHDNSPKVTCGQTAFELQRHFLARTRMWRIILPLGRGGTNIPNLSFLDDEAGEAEKVVAIDVNNNIWLLDIWKIGAVPVRWPDPYTRDHQHALPGGWGVLVLPCSSFKPTKTIHESLGLPGREVMAVTKPGESRIWLDTSCSLYYIKDFPTNPDTVFRQRHTRLDYAKTHACKSECQEDDLSDVWETVSDSGDEGGGGENWQPDTAGNMRLHPMTTDPGAEQWSAITPFSGRPDSGLADMTDEAQMSRGIIPSFGETPLLDGDISRHSLFSRLHNDRQRRIKYLELPKADFTANLVKNYCLLRTTLTDVELQPFDRNAPCIESRYLLTHQVPAGVAAPWDFHSAYSERINMLIHVPELNLVAAGSPTGRVALITLTKTAKRLHLTRVQHGFRVDCVLPRKSEDDKRLRPGCTLIGLAMSPVPTHQGRGLKLRLKSGGGRAVSTMYRLIMHYKDHTILMYDVARGVTDQELLIF
ncbi:hypothetical protein C8A05DRAFT_12985 [Staphylotrichum tortipilum]|uniref:Pyridine nucleotide-disulfide oxidoreductase family protein n=1 Tax=Staphylotrichum tortipilum TaxID=2831512 RepID=A0AAN6MRM8_9PEZI|nr:hypothetical protein C8A05DRAFT_12985 [Staphylotrichum longicolle]